MIRLKDIDLRSYMGKSDVAIKFLLKSKELKKAKNGTQFLNISIMDGDIEELVKFWSFTNQEFEKIQTGKVYVALISVQSYNNAPSLIGKEIKMIDEPVSDYANILRDRKSYINLINEFHSKITDKYLHLLIRKSFELVGFEGFMNGVGGLSVHHTEVGGLLRHTVEVLQIASSLCDIYEEKYGKVNRDLVMAGAMLHDLGKVREYNINLEGFIASYNTSNLVGHIPEGLSIIGQAHYMTKSELGNSINDQTVQEQLRLINNIIASHHGIKDWGAEEEPKTIEAEIVFISDYVSSKFDTYNTILSKLKVGEYDSKFNIYKHQSLKDI